MALWSRGRAKNQVWTNQKLGNYDIKLIDERNINERLIDQVK